MQQKRGLVNPDPLTFVNKLYVFQTYECKKHFPQFYFGIDRDVLFAILG